MSATAHLFVDVDQLRPGMFVQLELSWMDHPFPRSHFRLTDERQIATLRELGLRRVQVRRDLSDPSAFDVIAQEQAAALPAPPAPPAAAPRDDDSPAARRRALLRAQHDSLARSERLHGQASRAWLNISRDALQHPTQAREIAASLASSMTAQLCEDDNVTIRMLTEAAGNAASQHAINVSVLALMLGRAMGLAGEQLESLALGALLHDIGKLLLADNLRQLDGAPPALVERERRDHVAHGVRLGMAMGLDPQTLRVIGQHHELRDGSGLPQGLKGDAIAPSARIVALVDQYDRLCNPRSRSEAARTPHEVQAQIYAQMRNRLDVDVLTTFVRMLGVYPPGSVVQLSDERVAMVVAVHPQHPLRPSVLVYDPRVAPADALYLHLAQEPALSVRRSLHPQHLSRAMLDYLSPRDRVYYYFAHGLEPVGEPAARAA